jgi:hypothetical protein
LRRRLIRNTAQRGYALSTRRPNGQRQRAFAKGICTKLYRKQGAVNARPLFAAALAGGADFHVFMFPFPKRFQFWNCRIILQGGGNNYFKKFKNFKFFADLFGPNRAGASLLLLSDLTKRRFCAITKVDFIIILPDVDSGKPKNMVWGGLKAIYEIISKASTAQAGRFLPWRRVRA